MRHTLPTCHHLTLALLLLTCASHAREVQVADAAAFSQAAKKAQAGDVLILKNGTWADAQLKLHARGTAEKPVTVRAETAGRVVLTGDSRLSLGGTYGVVEGLWFQNPTGEETVELRLDSDTLAEHCRVSHCAVTNDLPADAAQKTARFMSIYGGHNRVDHCYLAGKTTPGTTLVVWLAEGVAAQHRLDHNHFGPRQRLGKNGGETIRVGDSKTSMMTAACVVEHNLFEKCDGEAECISNKSCGNLYQHNTFLGVSGTLTLRHGNGCRVVDNLFLGNKAKGAGGVRVIGEDHVVTGNVFQDLTGDKERSAMCFMLGIPNSAANGYFQVKRAKVTGNTFINCTHNILVGLAGDKKAKLPPLETEILGNTIQTNHSAAFDIQCPVEGVTMKNNTQTPDAVATPKRPAAEPTGPSWRK